MFFVPGALGIQEGGYVVVGRLLGIPAEMGLALALIRRVRELAFGIPGLIAWQIIEGSQAWKNTTARIASAEIGTEGPLHRMFGTKVRDFQVVLVGKDGRSTLQWSKPVSSEVLFSVIDKMPMRRDEMRQQRKGGAPL